MPKRMNTSNFDSFQEGSAQWNVAQPYSEFKLMNPLRLLDEYEELATFGTLNVQEEFQLSEQVKTRGRVKGIERFYFKLVQLIGNCIKLIKQKDLRLKLSNYSAELVELKKMMPFIKDFIMIQRPKPHQEEVIKEKEFSFILSKLSEIKIEVVDPLYKSGLIYPYDEDIDPYKQKDMLKYRMGTQP